MRLSDLLGAKVFDAELNRVGRVHDVRVVKDGPVIGTFGASFRISGLIVGRGSIGTRLGFGRAEMKGPKVLVSFFNARHSSTKFVPWDAVEALKEGWIKLSCDASELPEPERLNADRMNFG